VVKRIAKWRGSGAVPQPAVALDLRGTRRVNTKGQGGALGLAFHPAFRSNGRFYVSFLSDNAGNKDLAYKLVVSEFRMTSGASAPNTEKVVLEVPKSRQIHQAGGIAFGPDGKLYIGVGDNGSKNDVDGNAQNANTLLGKILRIDVDAPSGGRAYGIPADNPWATTPGVRAEIWGYGFRNPWRFSWDAAGTMWVAEPGSSDAKCREWVSIVQRGGNHGWPHMEGTKPNAENPGKPGAQYVPRAFDYGRDDPDQGSCIIGGRVYAGARVPALNGRYIFSDYEMEEVYCLTLAQQGGRWTGSDFRKIADVPHVASIDVDAQGELYFCVNNKADVGGTVMTLAPK
jgi:glucose/arabinose dehydrogenase